MEMIENAENLLGGTNVTAMRGSEYAKIASRA
jgi:hypothetical protein